MVGAKGTGTQREALISLTVQLAGVASRTGAFIGIRYRVVGAFCVALMVRFPCKYGRKNAAHLHYSVASLALVALSAAGMSIWWAVSFVYGVDGGQVVVGGLLS